MITEPEQHLSPTLTDKAYIEQLQFLQHNIHISNSDVNRIGEKRAVLKAVGYSEEQVDTTCRPEPLDKEAALRRVGELSLAAQRELRNENRQPKSAPIPIYDSTGHQVQWGEIIFVNTP